MHRPITPRPRSVPVAPLADEERHRRDTPPTGMVFLRVVRLMANGGISDARAASVLMGQFGAGYRRPLILMRAMMLELARASTRPILLAPPCCGRITHDEAIMLEALRHDEGAFDACHAATRMLLCRNEALGAATCFRAVATCFADLGCPFD